MKKELKTVLCIDDEADILDVASLALEMVGGLSVARAGSGAEGIKQAKAVRPDLILLDVMMPAEDGPATLARMRADPEIAGIPVIFMTARVQQEDIEKYLSLGAAGVIEKPFDPMTLAGQARDIWEKAA